MSVQSRRTRLIRVARWTGIVALGLIVAYNVLLNASVLPSRLSDEERVVTWDFAWAILPNRIHVSGFRIEELTGSLHWSLDLDEAVFWLDLGALTGKEFHPTSLEAHGVDFALARRPPPLDTEPPDPQKKRWHIWLEWVELAGVRSVCIFEACVRGDARVRGGFRLQPVRWFEVGPAALYVDGERVELDGVPVAEELEGVVRVTLRRVSVPSVEGLDHFRYLDSDVDLHAVVPRVERLSGAAGSSKPSAGRAEVRVRAQVREGVLTEETRIDGSVRGIALPSDDHLTWLGGPVRARVRAGKLGVRFGPGQLRARTREAREMQLSSDRLRIAWAGIPANLSELRVLPTVRASVSEGEVDAAFATPWLPSVLAPQAGHGPLSGEARFDADSGTYRVRARSNLEGVTIVVPPARLRANVRVEVRAVRRGDRLDVNGTRIHLSDTVVQGSEENVRDWWGRLHFTEPVDRRDDERIANRVRVRARDAMPVLAILEATDDPPDIAQRLLEMQGLEGSAIAHLGNGVEFREIDLSGDGIDLEGWFAVRDERTQYRLYFDAGIPSLGIVRDDDGVSFHPFGIGM